MPVSTLAAYLLMMQASCDRTSNCVEKTQDRSIRGFPVAQAGRAFRLAGSALRLPHPETQARLPSACLLLNGRDDCPNSAGSVGCAIPSRRLDAAGDEPRNRDIRACQNANTLPSRKTLRFIPTGVRSREYLAIAPRADFAYVPERDARQFNSRARSAHWSSSRSD